MTDFVDHPLERGLAPSWVSAWGDSIYGPWVEIAVGEVSCRMYWIYPGTFRMGSPEDEPGRYDREVVHEVTITRGFWMGATPCTQAFWSAVMGTNPSRFVDPRRPVENVTWADTQEFLAKLQNMQPGLHLQLPTEAQWEYCCRAGTDTATYAGPIKLQGENNAPVLDPIAWYGGNSGHNFELDDGFDSSGWPEMQYLHTKAGTHPVAKRHPNPWGLHDTLGNVWEWCDDYYDGYGDGHATDPIGPDTGTERVRRGGSWSSPARYVRAAYRNALDPSDRDSRVGFRLSRGHSALSR